MFIHGTVNNRFTKNRVKKMIHDLAANYESELDLLVCLVTSAGISTNQRLLTDGVAAQDIAELWLAELNQRRSTKEADEFSEDSYRSYMNANVRGGKNDDDEEEDDEDFSENPLKPEKFIGVLCEVVPSQCEDAWDNFFTVFCSTRRSVIASNKSATADKLRRKLNEVWEFPLVRDKYDAAIKAFASKFVVGEFNARIKKLQKICKKLDVRCVKLLGSHIW